MNVVCLWRGHKWKTVDEYKVERVKSFKFGPGTSGPAGMIKEMFEKAMGGYKVIHQECTQCGDRRSFHKW